MLPFSVGRLDLPQSGSPMSSSFDATSVGLFLLVVFPGLVSTAIYRLLMPARALEWGNALLQGCSTVP